MPNFDYQVITLPWKYDHATFAADTRAVLVAQGAAKWELVLIVVHPNLTATAVFKK